MNSRESWNVEGIEPSVRERAEAAARRAGLSLSDWLNSTIGDTAPTFTSANQRPRADQPPVMPRPAMPHREAADVAEIHYRLDAITRQIEQFSKPAGHEPGVARQLNDAISRLDARLSQINEPPRATEPASHGHDTVERAAAQVYSATPVDPFSLDFAISEITARQSELDGVPRMSAPPIAPTAASIPDASAIERQLSRITSQIDALQRPDTGIEQSIAAFRSELAEIRSVVTEALPRRAIESLENEIRSLAQRIDDSKQSGIDNTALAGVERALGEIRETLHALTPAEQLAGFDDAIRNLGGKIDLIVRSSDDPGTMQQLEGAIAALRAIVSNVASNEALGRLSEDVHSLSMKVDQLARTDTHSDSFAALEARIVTLTTALENRDRPQPAPNSDHLEGALKALSDRLDHMPVGNDSSAAFAHLEQRVSYLLERIETTTDPRAGNLGRVEDGLQDILRHLERQQASFAALTEARSLPTMDPALVDTIKRELSDMRFSQSETDRHTQDSLEVVHSTLGHVVDRLAIIEGDLRSVKTQPSPPPIPHAPVPRATVSPTTVAPPPRPQLSNPVQAAPPKAPVEPTPVPPQGRSGPVAQFDAAPREFAATAISHEPAPAFAAPKNELPKSEIARTEIPKAISDILDPQPAERNAPSPKERASTSRPMVDPQLPPDFPLEPGTRPQARIGTPSERIAASEEAISEIADAKEQANASSFIAAARRAAKAAAASGPDKSRPAVRPAAGPEAGGSTISSKIRSLLVGASVVVIVLGSFKMAMTLLDTPSNAPFMQHAQDVEPLEEAEPAEAQNAPAAPAPAPSLTSPTPMGQQSLNAQAPAAQPVPQAAPQAPAVPYISPDVTGSITAPQPPVPGAVTVLPPSGTKLQTVSIPATERLPDGIGSAALRHAALKGDASAAYEIGVRFAEGKGVPANFDEAAKWYGRAADAGVVPAMFRLGTLYEKGMSVKKDVDAARRYYLQAAERGNAKAMHNLAVLDADGSGRGANYKSASLWFRKAAERGVADSQFNLGILYARGIGVEQNLAESFKWFSLAAAQGDADAGRKRDDVAKRLDPASLSAAKLAVQSFIPEGQPADAINVTTPAGGWDGPEAAKPNTTVGKRAAK
jgi:localization factor PodJL